MVGTRRLLWWMMAGLALAGAARADRTFTAGTYSVVLTDSGSLLVRLGGATGVTLGGLALRDGKPTTGWACVDERRGATPVVTLRSPENVTLTLTLLPRLVRLQCTAPAAGDPPGDPVPATLACTLGADFVPEHEERPTRWLRHPSGGAPVPTNAGTVACFRRGNDTLAIAGDHGAYGLVRDGKLHLIARKNLAPWAAAGWTVSAGVACNAGPAGAASALSLAGSEPLLLRLETPGPFGLSARPGPIALTAHLANLAPQTRRVRLTVTARDWDGGAVLRRECERELPPAGEWRETLPLVAPEAGPLFVEAEARSGTACSLQRTCVGVLPERPFRDGAASRFGISAYTGHIEQHAAVRSEADLLALMQRLGVRWLRMSNDRKLAHRLGFHTFYQNGPSGPVFDQYRRGEPTWMGIEANRRDFLKGNLDRTRDQGDEYFEFSNEWNLWGGERQALLAGNLARDWMQPLAELRQQLAPGVKLAGAVVANADLPFLQGLYDAGAWDSFEALAFHASGVPKAPDLDDPQDYWTVLGTLAGVRQALRRFGDKELWMTEFYAPVAPNSSITNNERIEAEHLVLTCALGVAAGVRNMMLYRLDDIDLGDRGLIAAAADVGEPTEREQYFGMLHRDWSPKATLWAYQTAAWMLDGATFAGDVRLPDPALRGLAFDGPHGRLALLWSRAEGAHGQEPYRPALAHPEPWEDPWRLDRTVPVRVPASGVTVVDCIGRRRGLRPDATGQVRLALSGAPVFVLGADWATERGRFSRMLEGARP